MNNLVIRIPENLNQKLEEISQKDELTRRKLIYIYLQKYLKKTKISNSKEEEFIYKVRDYIELLEDILLKTSSEKNLQRDILLLYFDFKIQVKRILKNNLLILTTEEKREQKIFIRIDKLTKKEINSLKKSSKKLRISNSEFVTLLLVKYVENELKIIKLNQEIKKKDNEIIKLLS